MGRKFLHYLGHGNVLGFEAFISPQAGRLDSNPGTASVRVISEHSHHSSQLSLLESYHSARFNAVTRPLPKEGSNNNIWS